MNSSAGLAVLVPLGVVTVTSTVPPATSAGEVALAEVEEMTVKLVAGVEPKATALAPVKLLPVMMTEVAPAGRPAAGLTTVTEGPAHR